VSTFTEPLTVPPGSDVSTSFPSEPAGWGEPGSVRHAEAIGHGVWMAEHPEERSEEDESHLDYDPTRAAALDQLLDDTFGKPTCGVLGCILPPHDARYRQHEDAQGRAWYPGEAPR
jgi:hypothetical protein